MMMHQATTPSATSSSSSWSVSSLLGMLMPTEEEKRTELMAPTTSGTTPVPSFFPEVLQVGVGMHLVSLTIDEEGLTVIKKGARGLDDVTEYCINQIEWFAFDDVQGELLVQYHDFITDDKFQVSFRTPYYKELFFSFSYYLERRGQQLLSGGGIQAASASVDDVLSPVAPCPGSPHAETGNFSSLI